MHVLHTANFFSLMFDYNIDFASWIPNSCPGEDFLEGVTGGASIENYGVYHSAAALSDRGVSHCCRSSRS